MPHGFVWREGTSPIFKNVCIIKKWDCSFNIFNLPFIQNIFSFLQMKYLEDMNLGKLQIDLYQQQMLSYMGLI